MGVASCCPQLRVATLFDVYVSTSIRRNTAIASYLKSQGYSETLECFEREADVVS